MHVLEVIITVLVTVSERELVTDIVQHVCTLVKCIWYKASTTRAQDAGDVHKYMASS